MMKLSNIYLFIEFSLVVFLLLGMMLVCSFSRPHASKAAAPVSVGSGSFANPVHTDSLSSLDCSVWHFVITGVGRIDLCTDQAMMSKLRPGQYITHLMGGGPSLQKYRVISVSFKRKILFVKNVGI